MMTLRALTAEDWETARTWRASPLAVPTMGESADYKTDAAPAQAFYALMLDGVLAGVGGLSELSVEPEQGRLCLALAPRNWLHGYARQAIKLLLAEALGPLQLKMVVGECLRDPAPTPAFWRPLIADAIHDNVAHAGVWWHDSPTLMKWKWVSRSIVKSEA